MSNQAYHCCYHCKDRKIGCHSTCKTYLDEINENKKKSITVRKEKEIYGTIIRNNKHRRVTRKSKRKTK